MDFFTADLHLGHEAIVRLDKRPFASIDEHDQTVVANWNAVVSERDTVYALGDIAFGTKAFVRHVLGQLRGRICLIRGNHDHRNVGSPGLFDRFEWVKDMHYYRGSWDEEKVRIVLCHYPLLFWQNSRKGAWHLFGHCHGGAPERRVLALDIGCSLHGYKPVSLPQVVTMFRELELAGHGPCWQHEERK